MAEIRFNDRGQVIIKSCDNKKIIFSGYPIELNDNELESLIRTVAKIQNVLKEESNRRLQKKYRIGKNDVKGDGNVKKE
jgi:hypothetical protein